jgi:isochorismate hydrolase
VIYTGLRSDSIKNHASRHEALLIAAMRIIFTHIGCTLLTCDIYMSDLRHRPIHDPVLSFLKMEGIRFFLYCNNVTNLIRICRFYSHSEAPVLCLGIFTSHI